MSPGMRFVVARHVLGLATVEEYFRVGHDLHDAGVRTPLVPWGHARSPGVRDAAPLFEATLRQLGIEPPTRQGAAEMLVRHYLWPIAEEVVKPVQALYHLVEKFYKPLRGEVGQLAGTRELFRSLANQYSDYCRQMNQWGAAFAIAVQRLVGGWVQAYGLTTPEPAWLTWNDGTVVRLARAIRDQGAYDRLPILGDALEEAGCTHTEMLAHCRQPGEHVRTRSCLVVDRLLGER